MTQVDEPKTEHNGDGLETGPSRTEFTPEQQGRVQRIIDDAYRRAYEKAARGGNTSEEVERLRAEVDLLKQDQKTAVILRALSRYNVVDASEVAELVGGHIKFDDSGNPVVVGSGGSEVIDSSGRPISVDDYMGRWLSERPHHLRSISSVGAGSGGARFGGSGKASYDLSNPQSWREMPRDDLDRLLKEGVNVHGSGGQVYKFKNVKNPFIEARKKRFQSGG